MNTSVIIMLYILGAFFFYLAKEYFSLYLNHRLNSVVSPALVKQVKGEYETCIWVGRFITVFAFVCSIVEYLEFHNIVG